jgi:glycosyltransferase involved in cell wall biosynthesis
MKIAILSDSAPPLSMGGVSSAHYMLCLFLRELGHDAHIFTFHDSQGGLPDDPGYIHRSCNNSFVEKIIKAVCRAYFYIRDRRKMACQTSYILGNIMGCIQVYYKLRVFAPQIIISPDYCAPLAFMHLPKNLHVIEIAHHNPERFIETLHYGVVVSKRDIETALALQRKGLRRVHTVVCPSRYMKDVFTKTYHDFTGKIEVIPNLVNSNVILSISPQSVALRLGVSSETPVIYIPSGGTAMKGERYIFSLVQFIAREHKTVCFYISGVLSVALQQEIKQSNFKSRVFAPGYTPYVENIAFAMSCSVCMSPALAENYSMALVEALTMGLPIVAFDVGGNNEIVPPSCGTLVSFLDLVGMKDAVCSYLKNEQREVLHSNAIDHAFALEQSGKMFAELLNSIERCLKKTSTKRK